MLTGTAEAHHTSVQKFFLEASLFKRVGLNFDDLNKRPWQEAVDYLTITSLIDQEEARQNAKAQAEANRGKR